MVVTYLWRILRIIIGVEYVNPPLGETNKLPRELALHSNGLKLAVVPKAVIPTARRTLLLKGDLLDARQLGIVSEVR